MQVRESGCGEVWAQFEQVMTGSSIVLNSCGMPGKSAEHRKRLLSEIRDRARQGNNLRLDVAAGDMCCEEKATWNDTVGELAKTVDMIQAESVGFLTFEDYDHAPTTTVITTKPEVNVAVSWTIEKLDKRPVGERTLGFDIENTPRNVAGAQPPYGRTDTIQLATAATETCRGRSWVIHCRGWAEKNKPLPTSLHNLLQDPTITKVGLCVSRDKTMLQKEESFPKTMVGPIEDCGKMAKAAAITPNARPKVTPASSFSSSCTTSSSSPCSAVPVQCNTRAALTPPPLPARARSVSLRSSRCWRRCCSRTRLPGRRLTRGPRCRTGATPPS